MAKAVGTTPKQLLPFAKVRASLPDSTRITVNGGVLTDLAIVGRERAFERIGIPVELKSGASKG